MNTEIQKYKKAPVQPGAFLCASGMYTAIGSVEGKIDEEMSFLRSMTVEFAVKWNLI